MRKRYELTIISLIINVLIVIILLSGCDSTPPPTSPAPISPPMPPTGLIAMPVNAAGITYIQLHWNTDINATSGFNVYRSVTPNVLIMSANKITVSPVTGEPPQYIDTSVFGGTTYYYRITSMNSGGESNGSAEISATATLPPTTPVITSINPVTGNIGTPVTITGNNFDAILSNNTVLLNGLTAMITAATTTSLSVIVPTSATTGLISVTTGGGTAISPVLFTVIMPAPGPLPPALTL